MDLSTLSSADIVSFVMAVTSLVVSAALFIYKIRNQRSKLFEMNGPFISFN